MADPQDRPDAGSVPGPPAKKATPRKAPAKKAPVKKALVKKAPAKKAPAKKVPAKKAAPRSVPTEPAAAPPTAGAAPHDAPDVTPPPVPGVGHPVSPPGPPARSGRYTRIPIAIGLAAASAGAMFLRRLRRG